LFAGVPVDVRLNLDPWATPRGGIVENSTLDVENRCLNVENSKIYG
jgi:hypothetical protein